MVSVCPTCDRQFDRPAKLKRHLLTHQARNLECPVCSKKIANKANYDRHVKTHEAVHKCDVCETVYKRKSYLLAHVNRLHGPSLQDKRYKCPDCPYLAKSQGRLYAHTSRKHLKVRLCPFCLSSFKKARSFVAHQKRCEMKKTALKYVCFVCRKRFASLHEKNRHVVICRRTRNQHGRGDADAVTPGPARQGAGGLGAGEEEGEWMEPTYALRGSAIVLRYYPAGNTNDLSLTVIANKEAVARKLAEHLRLAKGLKWSVSVSVETSREIEQKQGGEEGAVRVETLTKVLPSGTRSILVGSEEEQQQTEDAFIDVMNAAENLKAQGSSWVVTHVNWYELSLAKFKPILNSGGNYIETPKWLSRKRCVTNVRTKANKECFRLSILAALYPVVPPGRASDPRAYTQHYDALEFGNITSKNMKIRDVKRFCKLNPGFSLSVIGVEKKELFPLVCPEERRAVHITLLLLTKGRKRHYVLCRSLDRLLFSQNKHRHRKFFCCYCFSSFVTLQSRQTHEHECKDFGGQKIKYPPPGSCLEFGPKQIKQMSPVMFLVAYDFETLCVPARGEEEGADGGRKTVRLSAHQPFMYGLVAVNFKGDTVREPIVYSNPDPEALIHHFLDSLFSIEEICFRSRPNYAINISEQQEKEFQEAKTCWICEKGFADPENPKVRDHSPLFGKETGQYNMLGAAHAQCNIMRSRALFLPAICHNSAKFDLHMIMQYASTHPKFRKCDINILPRTMEVYRTMSLIVDRKEKREIRLLDSFQHFSTNLSDLVNSLSDDSWSLLRQCFPEERKQMLLRQKGVLCYDLLTSFDAVKNQKVLPEKKYFYNLLKQEALSDQDYERAKTVWEVFECDSLLAYTEIYCLTDVITLMQFWLHYRSVTAAIFGYEVCHFVSTPSLSMACALKYTKCSIPLISCPDTFLKFEKSIRGGLSGAVLRYAKANNPYTPDFDPDQPVSHILYSDVNALYSYEMAASLPAGDFMHLTPEQCSAINLRDLHASSHGALFEVDLEYGILINERGHHEEWPLAPLHLCPDPQWFSQYQKRVAAASGFNYAQKTKKLMSVIGPKSKYLIHSRLLEYYIEKGMKVTRYHGGVKYRTEAWLKPYIDFLMEQRQKATLPFMSSYFKLQSNSLYGSFLRRPRQDRTIKICQEEREFLKLTRKACFKGFRIFKDDLCAVELLKRTVVLSQPIFVASAILDHSKLHITKLYWEMKSHFSASNNKKLELILFDTDSIVCKVTTPELWTDLEKLKHLFDFSSLPSWAPVYSTEKARVPGYLKLEYGSQVLLEAVAIRSKVYSIRYQALPPGGIAPPRPLRPAAAASQEEADPASSALMRRCKGVPSSALNKSVQFEHYRKCVFEGLSKEISFHAIRSDGIHNVFTVQQQKQCLSAFDNKRKILACGIKTIPYCIDSEGRETEWPAEYDPAEERLRELVQLMDREEEENEEEEQDDEHDEGAFNLKCLLELWDTV